MSYESLIELTKEKTELESKVTVLQNKLYETQNLLNLMISKQTVTLRKGEKTSRNEKKQFYHTHKGDEDIQESVELYKKTFPNISVPWMFIKALTDEKYYKTRKIKKSLNSI
jgi:hypothetical protein